MNASPTFQIERCASIDDDAIGLTRIFNPDIQLAQWRRPADPIIAQWLRTYSGQLGSGFRRVVEAGAGVDLDDLPAGAGRDALANDLTLLAGMFGDLLEAPMIGLRLEVLHQAMCPRLHVDRVGIRLLCTYLGPGTEWVEDAFVDRRLLGTASGGAPEQFSGVLQPGYVIETIPPFSVALLKGTAWPDNERRGIIHRSPVVSHPPRILLAMDAIWAT